LIPIVLLGVAGALGLIGIPFWVALPVGFVVILFAYTSFLRLLYLTRQPEVLPIQPYRTLREPLPGLGAEAFNDWRRELMLLDFQPLGGARVLDENGALEHRVYDVWASGTHLCYAVIDQRLPYVAGISGTVRLTLWTGYGDRWWYGTFSTRPSKLAFLLRTPRTLWSVCPEVGVETLLQAHLEFREDIGKAIGRKPEVPLSLDSFLNGQAVQYAAAREALRGKSVLRGWSEYLFFESTPHLEWKSDLTL
jgi:hypothetical protein